MWVGFIERWGLRGVDSSGGEFAGLVDAEGFVEESLLFGGEGLAAGWLGFVEGGGFGLGCWRGGGGDDGAACGSAGLELEGEGGEAGFERERG